jgi:hypothetical protein
MPHESLESRVATLEQRSLEVMAEVEALRRERLADPNHVQRYAAAYQEVSLEAHDGSGVVNNKVVLNWEGGWPAQVRQYVNASGVRIDPLRRHEWAMLVRLGLAPSELEQHARAALERESYT